jgi:hypothetical protein
MVVLIFKGMGVFWPKLTPEDILSQTAFFKKLSDSKLGKTEAEWINQLWNKKSRHKNIPYFR